MSHSEEQSDHSPQFETSQVGPLLLGLLGEFNLSGMGTVSESGFPDDPP